MDAGEFSDGDSTLVEKNIDALAHLLQLNKAERALLLYGTLARYQRDLRSVLALQGEIASAIADKVRAALTPAERARLASARPVNPEAYEAYLKGRFHWYKLSREDLDSAERYLSCEP